MRKHLVRENVLPGLLMVALIIAWGISAMVLQIHQPWLGIMGFVAGAVIYQIGYGIHKGMVARKARK